MLTSLGPDLLPFVFFIFYFNNPLLVFRLSSPVCDSGAAHDRGPAQLSLQRFSTIAHPILNQMGSNLGSVLYIYDSCLNKPPKGQGKLLESRNPGKCLGSWGRFDWNIC